MGNAGAEEGGEKRRKKNPKYFKYYHFQAGNSNLRKLKEDATNKKRARRSKTRNETALD